MNPEVRTIKIGRVERSFRVDSATVRREKTDDGKGDRVFIEDLSFSSEEPVLRRPFFGEPFFEVLGHGPDEVELDRMRKKGPVRDEHRGPLVGVARDVWLSGTKGRATIELSRNREEARIIAADLEDDLIGNVSVAYDPKEYELVRKNEDGPDTYRVTRWEPIHIAFVGEPADTTVGVGRSVEGDDDVREVRVTIPDEFQREAGESPEGPESPTAEHVGERKMETEKKTVDVDAVRSEAEAKATKAERDRNAAIFKLRDELAEKYPEVRKIADDAISQGMSETEFSRAVFSTIGKRDVKETRTTLDEMPDPKIGMTEKDVRNYSLLRAAESYRKGERSFEIELSDELERAQGRSFRGFGVPYEVLADPNFLRRPVTAGAEERATVTTGGSGSGLKGTVLLASAFIDVLRERTVLAGLGATILEGLVGDVDIPKLTAGATSAWVTEGNEPAEDGTTNFDVISLVPHTVAARVPVTRRMLLQSTPGVENLVRNDLVRKVAIEIDRAGINGSGSAPTGILQKSIGAGPSLGTDGGAPTWAMVTKLEEEVAIDNADIGSLAYLTNPKVRGKTKTVEKVSGSGRFIWDSTAHDAPLNGYPVAVTNLVPSNLVKGASGATLSALIFGNFSDLLIGMWGILDVVPDPWTNVGSGGLVMRVFQDVDVNLRHDESFAASEEIATT